jgi:hypothetical protein
MGFCPSHLRERLRGRQSLRLAPFGFSASDCSAWRWSADASRFSASAVAHDVPRGLRAAREHDELAQAGAQ